ncbi:hypothetical protein [Ideonella sp. YS5]|uniref:hypothetical protein n=1 Tax=Ideonella sp. YS5 TaxID=3453714 RepID=UPI003EEE8B54
MSNPSSQGTETSHRGPAFDEAVLKEGPAREAVRILHPLSADTIQIATPAVRTVSTIVHKVISHRLPGTNFAGEPRIGKTTALEIVKKLLRSRYADIPVGSVLATSNTRGSEAHYWSDFCESFKLPVLSAREPKKARHKITNAIRTQCGATRSNVFVLLGDEVQLWDETEWSLLKDLGNLLLKNGIRLVHIGFAQQSLHTVKEMLRAAGRLDLIRRFLNRIHAIQGVMDVDELRIVLQQLDDPKFEYPPQSGICCAEFFMPAAYAGGWRLEGEAANFWAAFNVMSRRVAKRPAVSVGMGSVMLALKEFLDLCRSDDGSRFKGTRSQWLQAVEMSNFDEELC